VEVNSGVFDISFGMRRAAFCNSHLIVQPYVGKLNVNFLDMNYLSISQLKAVTGHRTDHFSNSLADRKITELPKVIYTFDNLYSPKIYNR